MKKYLFGVFVTLNMFLHISVTNASSYMMHTVQNGESLFKIASKYNMSLATLSKTNPTQGDHLLPGTMIKIKPLDNGKPISILVNNNKLSLDVFPYLENSRTFVPIRSIGEALNSTITWDEASSTIKMIKNNNVIIMKIGSSVATINQKTVYLDAPPRIYENRTFVPVRFISEAFEANVVWDANNHIVKISTDTFSTGSVIQKNSYSEEDVYWLSRIIQAESEAEPYSGKLGVANVILNRVKSSAFPNSVKEVVFDTHFGVQFTPISNGTIYNTPSSDSLNAAIEALNGKNNIGNALYFLNPLKATSPWITQNRTFSIKIGNHFFYV